MEKLTDISPTNWQSTPKPATTKAMVDAFWHRLFRERTNQAVLDWLHGFGNVVYADPYATPFVIRLYGNHAKDRRVAYLSVVDGYAEWRFGTKDMGYAKCPVATDPELIAWLDSLFWWYTATEAQKKKTGRPVDMKHLVADRIRTIKKKQGTWKRNRSY